MLGKKSKEKLAERLSGDEYLLYVEESNILISLKNDGRLYQSIPVPVPSNSSAQESTLRSNNEKLFTFAGLDDHLKESILTKAKNKQKNARFIDALTTLHHAETKFGAEDYVLYVDEQHVISLDAQGTLYHCPPPPLASSSSSSQVESNTSSSSVSSSSAVNKSWPPVNQQLLTSEKLESLSTLILHKAIDQGKNINFITALIKLYNFKMLLRTNEHGQNVLHYALEKNNFAVIKTILELKNEHKEQKSILVLLNATTETVKPETALELAERLKIPTSDKNMAADHIALKQNRDEILHQLKDRLLADLRTASETDLLQSNAQGYTPLHKAVAGNKVDEVEALLSNKNLTARVMHKPNNLGESCFALPGINRKMHDQLTAHAKKLDPNFRFNPTHFDELLYKLGDKVEWLKANEHYNAAIALSKLVAQLNDLSYERRQDYSIPFKTECSKVIDAFLAKQNIMDEVNQYRGCFSIKSLLTSLLACVGFDVKASENQNGFFDRWTRTDTAELLGEVKAEVRLGRA